MCASLRPWFDCEVVVASEDRRARLEIIDEITVRRLGMSFNLAGSPVCPAMVRAIAESRADLVHVQWPNPFAFLAYLASRRRGALVISWQSDIVRQKILGGLFAPVARAMLKRADRVIVSSPGYAADSPFLSECIERVRVIPIGIAVERFQRIDHSQVQAIRARYGDRIVLAVGRLVYYKGFEHLLRAAQAIDAAVLIVGEGPLRRALERECRQRGLDKKIFFPGAVSDIVPFYQACDVFVLPSVARSEAFGIVQLEAMACAKPVVNTRLNSGVTYVSPGGVTGITVEPGNPEALAAAINELLRNRELREKYADAALARVQQEFSVQTMASRIRDLYDEVLSSRASRPAFS